MIPDKPNQARDLRNEARMRAGAFPGREVSCADVAEAGPRIARSITEFVENRGQEALARVFAHLPGCKSCLLQFGGELILRRNRDNLDKKIARFRAAVKSKRTSSKGT